MKNINEEEETPKKFINDLNKSTQRTNQNVQAYNRYNRAKNELASESGGDFWEGGTKEKFFDTVRQAVNKLFANNTEQLKYYQKMINKYEQITPEHENVKTHTQSVIDKENNKPVNKFNSKTGKYFEY